MLCLPLVHLSALSLKCGGLLVKTRDTEPYLVLQDVHQYKDFLHQRANSINPEV